MTPEKFEALVRRLESAEKNHPKRFVWGTGLLAAVGFSYLAGVLLVSLALLTGILVLLIAHPNAGTVKLALVLGVLFGGMALAILRALCVRLQAPDGVELTPTSAPGLMALVERLRQRVGSTRFHRVLLTGEYNASVVQHPRLGRPAGAGRRCQGVPQRLRRPCSANGVDCRRYCLSDRRLGRGS